MLSLSAAQTRFSVGIDRSCQSERTGKFRGEIREDVTIEICSDYNVISFGLSHQQGREGIHDDLFGFYHWEVLGNLPEAFQKESIGHEEGS